MTQYEDSPDCPFLDCGWPHWSWKCQFNLRHPKAWAPWAKWRAMQAREHLATLVKK